MSGPPKQNIANAERVGRVVLGDASVFLGIAVLAGGPAFWAFLGTVLAVAAGLDLDITGARGYCRWRPSGGVKVDGRRFLQEQPTHEGDLHP